VAVSFGLVTPVQMVSIFVPPTVMANVNSLVTVAGLETGLDPSGTMRNVPVELFSIEHSESS
jgi:hypothetical protein